MQIFRKGKNLQASIDQCLAKTCFKIVLVTNEALAQNYGVAKGSQVISSKDQISFTLFLSLLQ